MIVNFEDMMAGGMAAGNGVAPAPADSISGFDKGMKTLESMSLDDLINRLVSGLVDFAIHLAIAILVFYVGKFIITKIYNITSSVFIRRRIDRSLATFVLSLIRIVLYFILVITVVGILGIETSSFLALFASAGVAVGLALSGTLQNFAGGVLILLLKPYKIGDYIEAQGYSGIVKEIQIFSTIINTPDNKQIIIPNGGLSTSSINNYSKEEYRRVDWSVSIAYGDDVDVAKAAILDMLRSDDRIVVKYVEDDRKMRADRKELEETSDNDDAEPEAAVEPVEKKSWIKRVFNSRKKVTVISDRIEAEHAKTLEMLPKADRSPFVALGVLNSSSIDITVRAWTRSEFYWGVFYEMNERFYKELPEKGLHFPFPQMDVHLNHINS